MSCNFADCMHTNIIHKFGALTLAMLYLATMLKPLIPVVHYTLNFGVYANELCENRDKPELHCNGTCQLMQKLQIEEETETPAQGIPVYEGLDHYIGLSAENDATLNPIVQYQSFSLIPYLGMLNFTFTEHPTPPPQIMA